MKKHDVKHAVKAMPEAQEERRNFEDVDKSLRTIYQAEEGEIVDMTRLEKVRSYRWIWVTLSVTIGIIMLTSVAWAGFSFFKAYQGFGGTGLIMSVEGPERIALGQETTYFINYYNTLREPLSRVQIRVNLPRDFVITSSIPPGLDQSSVWDLGSLAAEQRGAITVRGRFNGALGTRSAIQAVATYRPASYSSDFESLAAKQIDYTETVIEGSVQVPEKAIPGDHLALIYHVKNTGSDNLTDLRLRMTLPVGFTVDIASSSSLDFEGQTVTQILPMLASGTSTDFIITGVFASGLGGEAHIKAETGRLGENGEFLPMQIASADFPLLAGDLSLKLVAGGSDDVIRSVGFGETLHMALSYENTSDEDLKDVTLRLRLDTVNFGTDVPLALSLIDQTNTTSVTPFALTDGVLVWSKEQLPDLAILKPHASGQIDLTVPLIAVSPTSTPLAIRVSYLSDIKVIGKSDVNRRVSLEPFVFNLRSDAALSAEARYYTEEGAPLGVGPIPPLVGQATRYRLIWQLNKKVHSLKDISVYTVLPRSVSFVETATSTAGEIAFNDTTRELRWTLNRLPADIDQAEIQFDLAITPTLADDGRFAELTGNTTFQATDDDIKQPILQVTKSLTTDLQNDESAKGKGVVRKETD